MEPDVISISLMRRGDADKEVSSRCNLHTNVKSCISLIIVAFAYREFSDSRAEVHLGNFEMRGNPGDLDFALRTAGEKSHRREKKSFLEGKK